MKALKIIYFLRAPYSKNIVRIINGAFVCTLQKYEWSSLFAQELPEGDLMNDTIKKHYVEMIKYLD